MRGGACSRLWPGERQHAPEHAVLQHDVVVERGEDVHDRHREHQEKERLVHFLERFVQVMVFGDQRGELLDLSPFVSGFEFPPFGEIV